MCLCYFIRIGVFIPTNHEQATMIMIKPTTTTNIISKQCHLLQTEHNSRFSSLCGASIIHWHHFGSTDSLWCCPQCHYHCRHSGVQNITMMGPMTFLLVWSLTSFVSQDFANPANMLFNYPLTTGVSYSLCVFSASKPFGSMLIPSTDLGNFFLSQFTNSFNKKKELVYAVCLAWRPSQTSCNR